MTSPTAGTGRTVLISGCALIITALLTTGCGGGGASPEQRAQEFLAAAETWAPGDWTNEASMEPLCDSARKLRDALRESSTANAAELRSLTAHLVASCEQFADEPDVASTPSSVSPRSATAFVIYSDVSSVVDLLSRDNLVVVPTTGIRVN